MLICNLKATCLYSSSLLFAARDSLLWTPLVILTVLNLWALWWMVREKLLTTSWQCTNSMSFSSSSIDHKSVLISRVVQIWIATRCSALVGKLYLSCSNCLACCWTSQHVDLLIDTAITCMIIKSTVSTLARFSRLLCVVTRLEHVVFVDKAWALIDNLPSITSYLVAVSVWKVLKFVCLLRNHILLSLSWYGSVYWRKQTVHVLLIF